MSDFCTTLDAVRTQVCIALGVDRRLQGVVRRELALLGAGLGGFPSSSRHIFQRARKMEGTHIYYVIVFVHIWNRSRAIGAANGFPKSFFFSNARSRGERGGVLYTCTCTAREIPQVGGTPWNTIWDTVGYRGMPWKVVQNTVWDMTVKWKVYTLPGIYTRLGRTYFCFCGSPQWSGLTLYTSPYTNRFSR